MTSSPACRDLIGSLNISESEYDKIVEYLGREPNVVELGMFSAMWSEHCSYKTSKPLLKGLYTDNPAVVQGPGENAGVVRLEDGLEIAFKIESHNHPSFVEPFNGAATGVGGILRDIIAMGARPIAVLDSLYFGTDEKANHILKGVVSGISAYGNCIGVPTVGGSVFFDPCYDKNPLVNVMAIGLVGESGIFRSKATGEGNLVVVFGSPTGKDGINGASFASQDFDDDAMKNRPAVQIADPFMGKLLMEACEELFRIPGVVAVQDMGAAGFTCGSAEMAASGCGMLLDIDKVPVREANISPYEIMLSETQERMMVVVEPGARAAIQSVMEKWKIPWAVVGELTSGSNVTLRKNGQIIADISAAALADGCPQRPVQRFSHEELVRTGAGDIDAVLPSPICSPQEAFVRLIRSPSLRSRQWIFQQYDYSVGTNTVLGPGSDAALIRIKDRDTWIAATTDCNPRYCYLSPYLGAMHSVLEAARNLACVGASPVGMTDCLNFGNPEHPEIYAQLCAAIQGMNQVAEKIDIPIVGGNVSLYNQTEGEAIFPSPVIGMVGKLPGLVYPLYESAMDREAPVTAAFREPGGLHREEGDYVYVIGDAEVSLFASEYLNTIHETTIGRPTYPHVERDRKVHRSVAILVNLNAVESMHDISDGGFAVAIAECCLLSGYGFKGKAPKASHTGEALFGEGSGRFIASVFGNKAGVFEATLDKLDVAYERVGIVQREPKIEIGDILVELSELREAWEFGFGHI